MCGRYNIKDVKELKEWLEEGGEESGADDIELDYNACPGKYLPVIANDHPRKIQKMLWGIVNHQTKGNPKQAPIANARIETIDKLPTFRHLIGKKHCLLPMTGYYEFLIVDTKKKRKQPYNIRFKDERIFAIAGIWETWFDIIEQTTIKSFATITKAAYGKLYNLNDRMPIILEKNEWQQWLDINSVKVAKEFVLIQRSDEELEFYAVDQRVNSTKNNGPELLNIPKFEQKDLFF